VDGELSENSIELPHGTVITVSEVQPIAPEGTTWSDPVYSHETFTLDADTTTAFTLEVINEISIDPTSPDPLGVTGSGFPWMGAGMATLLLIAGGLLLARRSTS